VIVNIAYNAIQAMQAAKSPERRIAIAAAADGPDAVTFTIADSGPGIPDDVLPRIFEPFFSTKQEGMGLGLSICKTIVEEHGGRLWAAPDSRQGAALSFSLPVVSAAGEAVD
jgi:signal transduction histidine kinase